MPIDPKSVKWDAPDPAAVQWDDAPAKSSASRMENWRSPQGQAMLKRELLASPPMAVARGIKDIIDTGAGFLSRLGGKEEQARVLAADKAGRDEFAAATEGQVMPAVGRFVGNMAAVNPILSRAGAAIATQLPRFGQAVASGGFSTGAVPAVGAAAKAGDLAIRTAGGGAAGFAGAGMVSPDDALFGAGVGAVLPGGLQVLGAGGRLVGGAFKGNKARAGETLARGLDATNPQDAARIAAQLRGAREFVPGSTPTVAQVLRTPQASILERVVGDSAGGVALKERELAQNAARLAAIERVAPTNPLGAASAKAEFGEALASTTNATDKAMRKTTSAKFKAAPQDEAMIYLPDLAAIRDDIIPPSSLVNRESIDKVVKMAEDIGISRAPGVPASYTPKRAVPLSTAIRKSGGINVNLSKEAAGGLRGVAGSIKNLVRRDGGLSAQRMAERMHEAGYLPDDTINSLLNALSDEAGGASVVSLQDEAFRSGSQVGSAAVPRKVTLRQLETLRQDIGEFSREAKPQSREKLALDNMRRALDDRIDEVVRGDGLIDENLPIDWANKLTEARKAKMDQVKTTGTGPQSFAMRRGQDGLPMYQSQELAARAWRQGIPPEDVAQLRVLIDKNPRLLDQFRGMVTSEGAGTATDAGRLSGKFVKWVDNSLPGLKAAFDPDQVKALQRVAMDIKRANAAAADGAAKGSPTYANASNALSLGLLDSKALNVAANRIPLVGQFTGSGLDWMRETARAGRARELANLLANPDQAANALSGFQRPNALSQMLAGPSQFALRAIPVGLAGDR